METVRRAKFAFCHIFPYSIRTGTPAAKLEQMSALIKRQREHKLIRLAKELETEFMKNSINKTETVLIETVKDSEAKGYTKNYIMTYFSGENLHEDMEVNVRLIDLYNGGMKAELI